MAGIAVKCINCGRFSAMLVGEILTCSRCNYEWSLEEEQKNARYIKTVLQREPIVRDSGTVIEPLPPVGKVPDDLVALKGIGKTYAETLNNNGVFTYAQLATMPLSDLSSMFEGKIKLDTLEKWVLEASEKLGD